MSATPTARSIVERAATIVAEHPCDMQSSADYNIAAAQSALLDGMLLKAMHHARRACTYSIGVFEPAYAALCHDIIDVIDELTEEAS